MQCAVSIPHQFSISNFQFKIPALQRLDCNDNRLTSLNVAGLAAPPLPFKIRLTLPGNEDGRLAAEGCYAKIFIWGANTCAPLTEAFEFGADPVG